VVFSEEKIRVCFVYLAVILDVYSRKAIGYPKETRRSSNAQSCFHALRHFGASLLDGANVSIGSIQRILGHENRSTTEIYLHSIGDSERQIMDILKIQFEDLSHTIFHTNKKGLQP